MKRLIAATTATIVLLSAPAAQARDIEVPLSTNTKEIVHNLWENGYQPWDILQTIISPFLAYIAPQSTDTLMGDENFIYTSN